MSTLEQQVLEMLVPDEGSESWVFSQRQRDALQRLRRKGLAEAVRCPDGQWVWFALPAAAEHVTRGSKR